jgi:hypothetical protein
MSCFDPMDDCSTRTPLRIAGFAVALLILVATTRAGDVPSPLGWPLPDFVLNDFRGREYRPADFQQTPLLVVAFLGTE